jgi:hypothetical protein
MRFNTKAVDYLIKITLKKNLAGAALEHIRRFISPEARRRQINESRQMCKAFALKGRSGENDAVTEPPPRQLSQMTPGILLKVE